MQYDASIEIIVWIVVYVSVVSTHNQQMFIV